jgi:hypothetical protein
MRAQVLQIPAMVRLQNLILAWWDICGLPCSRRSNPQASAQVTGTRPA